MVLQNKVVKLELLFKEQKPLCHSVVTDLAFYFQVVNGQEGQSDAAV